MKNQMTKSVFPTEEIEEKLGYCFKNKLLLKQAFTRSSYSKENRRVRPELYQPKDFILSNGYGYDNDNEVLEFIGDSIIGQLVVKQLTKRYTVNVNPNLTERILKLCELEISEECLPFDMGGFFPCELDEAELSELKIELVQSSALAAATERHGLEKYLIMSKGDANMNVQEQASVKEDLLEAIFGAVALDSSWDMTVLEALMDRLMCIDERLDKYMNGEAYYEKVFVNWYVEVYKRKPEFEACNSICQNLKYGVTVDLGDEMLNKTVVGFGNTEIGARKMASRRAIKFINKVNKMADSVLGAVGVPDPERAINQLQELYQKGLIPEPEYYYEEDGKSSNGNPKWGCGCRIEGVYETDGLYIGDSKLQAKKNVAFDAINYLIGRDLMDIFIEHGTMVIEQKTEEDSNNE